MELPGIVGVGAVVVGGLLVDRALLWAEARGWVYWRHNKAARTSMGTAMVEVQRILEPEKGHYVDQQAVERSDIDQAGDDPALD